MDNQNNGVILQKENTVEMPAGEVMTESYPNTSLDTAAAPSFPANANQPVYPANTSTAVQNPAASNFKFCKFCAAQIPTDAVLCTSCGRQVEQLQGANPSQQPQIVINNANNNTNTAVASAVVGVPMGRKKSKWVCLALWFFLGLVGGHKFYDGKIGSGLLYMFTGGFFVIGWFIDLFGILNRPNPYYVGY